MVPRLSASKAAFISRYLSRIRFAAEVALGDIDRQSGIRRA
jgi:hypothetical protein